MDVARETGVGISKIMKYMKDKALSLNARNNKEKIVR
jgi:hypothetical protein